MNRLHRMLVLVAPALIAGAVIATATIGEAQPTPTPAPAPSPAPHPGRHGGRHPVVVDADASLPPHVRDQIRAELDRALAEIDANEAIPPKIRARLHRALTKARASSMKDLAKLSRAMHEMTEELKDLDEDLAEQMPEIQREIDRAMREAAGRGKRARVVIAGEHEDDPWAGPGKHDDDDDDDDDRGRDDEDDEDEDDDRGFAFDIDLGGADGAIVIRRDGTIAGPLPPGAHGWPGVVPPVPPVPPMPPRPPVPPPAAFAPLPPAPPAPPALEHHGDMTDAFDIDIDIDLDDVKISGRQATKLREIADDAQADTERAADQIRIKSAELRRMITEVDVDIDEVDALVDDISREEATLRKARLRALIDARGVLTDEQRTRVQRGKR